ncbi:MAG TPA: hypothetical protein VK524_22555 [Polyangiaceae bacterium]|nr:hypothetical protein [Polyangiaceae bacterium]
MSKSDDSDAKSPAADAANPDPAEAERVSDAELRGLLRGALVSDESAPDVLRGVQQKLRQRSHGKFYDDVWSTAEHPPVYTYLLTSALMLAVIFAIYAVLIPTAGEPLPVTNEPAPVQIISPSPSRE